MVVMTAKVSKTKLIAAVCILAAIVCIALILLADSGGNDSADAANMKAGTNEERIAFLSKHGWEVDPQPKETQDVLIPENGNEVFSRYNELQKSQGYDLSRFAGKQVKRYVYSITNYEGSAEPVYATLLVYKNAVIGGDITATGGSGRMHGFTKPAIPKKAAETMEQPIQESTVSDSST